MKKKVWNYNIYPFPKSCARNNAKPFAFFTFGSSSFFWIFWYITHSGRLIITWVNYIVLYLEWVSRGHAYESMNQWKFWLSPGLIKNESLINQRTHKIASPETETLTTSQPACHVMCKVAYPKFATVYNPSSSLLELLSHPPTFSPSTITNAAINLVLFALAFGHHLLLFRHIKQLYTSLGILQIHKHCYFFCHTA